jgi:hypothetical protein
MTATATAFTFEVRDGVETDLGYVLDSWGKALRQCYPDTSTSEFFGAFRRYAMDVLRAESSLYVACPPDAPELIWGWALFRRNGDLEFAYVRRALRGIGIYRRLVGDQAHTYTRLTPEARRIKEKHPGAITVYPRF